MLGELPKLERAQAAREQERADHWRQQRLEQERQVQLRRLHEEEQACRQQLSTQAAAWAQQEQLRAYLGAAERQLVGTPLPSPDREAWLSWARAAAAAMYPTTNGELASLVQRVGRLQAGRFESEEDEG